MICLLILWYNFMTMTAMLIGQIFKQDYNGLFIFYHTVQIYKSMISAQIYYDVVCVGGNAEENP